MSEKLGDLGYNIIPNWDQDLSQVLKFGGENTFLGGKDFCFYYMF